MKWIGLGIWIVGGLVAYESITGGDGFAGLAAGMIAFALGLACMGGGR